MQSTPNDTLGGTSAAEHLHSCLLCITDEIDRICRQRKIQYFLIGGSLLGAVRHKGIIPWDDDIDIGMKRSEYIRFFEACKRELPEALSISEMYVEEQYGLPFIKIRLRNTEFKEEGLPKGYINQIFVDVFPIDIMPKSVLAQSIQHFFVNMYKAILLYNCKYDMRKTKLNGLFVFFAKTLAHMPKTIIMKRLVFWQTFFNNNKKPESYINLASSYPYGKEIFPIKSLEELQEVCFENRHYYIPSKAEEILIHLYGNFNQLPPEEQRIFRHVTSDIYFGPY